MESLQVGDVCITQNTVISGLNNGLIVVITSIDPWCNEGTTPFQIRRIDGQPIPTIRRVSGEPRFFNGTECWTTGYKLRRIVPDSKGDAQEHATELET